MIKWIIPLVVASLLCGCVGTRLSPVESRLTADVVGSFACKNPEDVIRGIEKQFGGYPLDEIAKSYNRPFWDCSLVPIGPDKVGLLVGVDSGSAVGNSIYLVYRRENGKLHLAGSFGGCEFRFLRDRATYGLYDVYTMWHMSANGGPYEYYRWTGSEYEVYKSGDLQKESQEK